MKNVIKLLLIVSITTFSVVSINAKDIEYVDLDTVKETVKETEIKQIEESKETIKEQETKEVVKEETKVTKVPAKLEKDEQGNLRAYGTDGKPIKSSWFTYKNNRYYIDKNNCALKEGWHTLSKTYYYMDANCKVHYGWLQLGDKIYYLNPQNKGALQLTPISLNGETYYFNADGSFSHKLPDQTAQQIVNTQTIQEQTQIATTINSLDSILKWVKNDVKRSEEYPVDQVYKNEAYSIINKFPKSIIQYLYDNKYQIFMCMEQSESNKGYLQKQVYRDAETKESFDEYLPYRVTDYAMFIDCSEFNISNLYYGMANLTVENITYQGKKPYLSSTWETIQKNKKEELDDLNGLNSQDFPFYKANAKTSLSSAVVGYLVKPSELFEYSTKAYSFIQSWFK